MKREREDDVTFGDVATEMISFERNLGRKFARFCKDNVYQSGSDRDEKLSDLIWIGHDYAAVYEKSVDFAQDQTNKYNVQQTLRELKTETKNLHIRLSCFTALDEVD